MKRTKTGQGQTLPKPNNPVVVVSDTKNEV